MKVRPAAAIIENDRLLTMRYRFGETDVYALPGGNPDPGEDMKQALARELQEEMGIDVRLNGGILCGEVLAWGGREDVLHCVFSAEIVSGIPHPDPRHTTAREVTWLPLSELAAYALYPNIGEQLSELLARERASSFAYIGRIDQPLH